MRRFRLSLCKREGRVRVPVQSGLEPSPQSSPLSQGKRRRKRAARGSQRLNAFCVSTGLSFLFLIVYGGCIWITSERSYIGSIYFEWERKIPFVPFFILPYMSIDLFFVAVHFFCRTDRELRIFFRRVTAAILVAGICFLLFPLRFGFARPHAAGGLGALFDWFRSMDAPYNLVPSLHAALCLLLVDLYARKLRGGLRIVVILWFVLIALSPLLTYQHHLIDIVSGFALAGYCFYFYRESADVLSSAGNVRVGAYYLGGATITLVLAIALWPWGRVALSAGRISCSHHGCLLRTWPAIFGKTKWPVAPEHAVCARSLPDRTVFVSAVPQPFEERVARVIRDDFDNWRTRLFKRIFPEPHSLKGIEDCVTWAGETTPEVLIESLRAIDGINVYELLGQVRVPTLALHGTDDKIVPYSHAQKMVAAIPGARLVTFERGGHGLFGRDAVKVNRLIRDFALGQEVAETTIPPTTERDGSRGRPPAGAPPGARGTAGGACSGSRARSGSGTSSATSRSPGGCATLDPDVDRRLPRRRPRRPRRPALGRAPAPGHAPAPERDHALRGLGRRSRAARVQRAVGHGRDHRPRTS